MSPIHVYVTLKDELVRNVTKIWCHLLIECVSVDKPGGGADDHQEVTGGDGHQDRVGRGHHPGSEREISFKHLKSIKFTHGIEKEMFSYFLSFFADKNIFKRIFST